MKQVALLIIPMFFVVTACSSPPQESMNDEEQFIHQLLTKMTLTEKVGQLNQYTGRWEMTGPAPKDETIQNQLEHLKEGKVGSMLNVTGSKQTYTAQKFVVENSRLGIPLIFGYDVIHGYQTMFPIPLGESASWNPELARLSASIAAKEAAAAGLHWTFAPMMDVGRDARWGRVMEGAGEDPYLTSVFSVARIKGFQGDDLSHEQTIAACAKHFAAYAFVESGRDYNSVEIGNETLHNIVLPPFKASVEAEVATFMNAFNTIQGMPATASSYLQRDLLKEQWGFDGFVVSDWNSIGEMIDHGAAADLKEAALKAIQGGSDMDMEARAYIGHLEELVNEGKVDIKLVDDAVKRVLRIKYRLGLFEDPYRYCNEEREKATIYTAEHRDAARKVARESMVLLKNEQQLLPLSKSIKSIAVIGPLADDKDSPLGNWRAKAVANSAISLLEGVQKALNPGVQIHYAKGCDLVTSPRNFFSNLEYNLTDKSGFPEAIQAAQKSEVVLLAIGEDCYQSGEGRSVTNLQLKGLQLELFEAIYKVNQNIVVVLMTGRPVDITKLATNAPAILETWQPGSEAGHAIADVLFGEYNPSGKLTMSFPRTTGQCPLFYNYKNTGRPTPVEPGQVLYSCYTDAPNSPLYPFGYGLSYTTFRYSDVVLSSNELTANDTLQASITVTNTGAIAGEEVVQLYIRDVAATYTRPVKELKAFRKIELQANESKQLTFQLTGKDLGYYTPQGDYVVEPGEYHLFAGGSSEVLTAVSFQLK